MGGGLAAVLRAVIWSFFVFCSSVLASSVQLSAEDLHLLTLQSEKRVAGRPAFEGVALLLQGPTLVWQYQSKQTSEGDSFDRHTGFFVGSVSKTLTAVLVMQQVEKGALDLQQSVHHYLPNLPQNWTRSVRLADLLSHSSGLVDIDTQQHYGQFRYNNLNFQLLGHILTAVTQQPYAELAQQLLRQCQMSNAGFADKAAHAIAGWHEEQGQLTLTHGFMPIDAEPSGGLIASATDVAQLPLCLQQQLSRTSIKQMTKPRVLRQHRWGEVYYGYGVQITQTVAGPEWSHAGYIPGYVAVFNYFPQQQLTLVVLENQSLDPTDLARAFYYHDSLRQRLIQLLSQN